MQVGRSQFVLPGACRCAEKLRVTLGPRELDADGLECPAIERAVDDISRERWTVHRIPAHLDVAVVAHRAHTLRNCRRRRFLCRGIVADANFIDEQRMPHPRWTPLTKDDNPPEPRAQRIDRAT